VSVRRGPFTAPETPWPGYPSTSDVEATPVSRRIAVLPGDGIGPEIMAATRQVLNAVGEFELDERPIGGASIDAHGVPLTE
jgi:hypothetical protein